MDMVRVTKITGHVCTPRDDISKSSSENPRRKTVYPKVRREIPGMIEILRFLTQRRKETWVKQRCDVSGVSPRAHARGRGRERERESERRSGGKERRKTVARKIDGRADR